MPYISADRWKKMINAYKLDVASFLARLAHDGRTITYAQMSERFDRPVRSWGDVLGGIAIRCHEQGLPLLSVLMVAQKTGQPSGDAVLYKDLGLLTHEVMLAEQKRCHGFNWASTPLWK